MLTHLLRHVGALAIAVLFLVGHAAPASAAPAAWSFVDVGLHVEQGQALLLVSGDLPDEVQLPYEAELAVPAGTQLQWIGEVLGGPPSEDPTLTYSKSTVGDMDIYRFTLTRSRTAQIEGVVAGMTGALGDTMTSSIRWTAWQDLASVRLSQRLPRGAQVVQASDGATMHPGDETYSYYAKTVSGARAGDVLDLSFSYTLPTAAPPVGTVGSGSSAIVPVFSVAAVVLLALVVYAALRQRPTRGAAAETAEQLPEVPAAEDAPVGPAGPERPGGARTGRWQPRLMIGAALIVVAVAAIAVLDGDGDVLDGRITRFFGSTSPCASVSMVLTPNAGVDLAERGAEIVDAFAGYDDIGDVTLTMDSARLDVTYCESSHTEAGIRGIVEGTGLVTLAGPAAAVPATATVDPTGDR